MAVTYADSWHYRRRRPLRPVDEDEARARHERGAVYTAVLTGEDGRPTAFVQLQEASGHASVTFLDERGRTYLVYSFRRPEGADRLFLDRSSHVTYREGGERDDEVAQEVTSQYDPDGHVRDVVKDHLAQTAQEREQVEDVTRNWEPVPAFGDYASIARVER